jgi:hypothetical protein
MKHVITVNDGDVVELVPQSPDASTKEDTNGFAAQLQSLPGAPADASRRKGVIISCPPLPQPPVMLHGEDVQGFLHNTEWERVDKQSGGGGYNSASSAYTAGVATGVAIAILFL